MTGDACAAEAAAMIPWRIVCGGCSGHSTGDTTLMWTMLGRTACGWLSGWPAFDPAVAAEQLATLKAELKQELAAIERQEKAAEAQLRPKSVEEVEQLETQLRDAFKELEKLKTELRKKKK